MSVIENLDDGPEPTKEENDVLEAEMHAAHALARLAQAYALAREKEFGERPLAALHASAQCTVGFALEQAVIIQTCTAPAALEASSDEAQFVQHVARATLAHIRAEIDSEFARKVIEHVHDVLRAKAAFEAAPCGQCESCHHQAHQEEEPTLLS